MGRDRDHFRATRIDAIEGEKRPGRGKGGRPVHVIVPVQVFLKALGGLALAPGVHVPDEYGRSRIPLRVLEKHLHLLMASAIDKGEVGRNHAEWHGSRIERGCQCAAPFHPRGKEIEYRDRNDGETREDCVTHLAALMETVGRENNIKTQFFGQSFQGIRTHPRTQHFLQGNNVGIQGADDLRRASHIGLRPSVQPRPTVNVVARNSQIRAHLGSSRRVIWRSQQ